MPNKDVPRSIRFTARLWDAIDQDARRCKRSSQKHLEAILETYYGIQDVEIDMPRIEEVRNLAPVVARIEPARRQPDDDAELRRQIQMGIDLAPLSEKKMPAKLEDKTNTIAKRKHSR